MDAPPPEAIPVRRYPSMRAASDGALVALATVGGPCWLRAEPGGIALYADSTVSPRLDAELSAFETEQSSAAAVARPAGEERDPWLVALFLWFVALLAASVAQSDIAGFTDRYLSSSTALLAGGEWWRPLTATFLHGDLGHLLGNLGLGALLLPLASRTLGGPAAWSGALACGALANIATALTQFPAEYRALGASGVLFAALGLLTGASAVFVRRSPGRAPWRSPLVPLGAGLALFGLYGVGGPGTDLLGHAFGFLIGGAAGALIAWGQTRR